MGPAQHLEITKSQVSKVEADMISDKTAFSGYSEYVSRKVVYKL